MKYIAVLLPLSLFVGCFPDGPRKDQRYGRSALYWGGETVDSLSDLTGPGGC
jgi:hypothetical protein